MPAPLRVQLVHDLKASLSPNDLEEELHSAAHEIYKQEGRMSVQLLQRRMRIGFARASAMVRRLSREGIPVEQLEPPKV